MGSSSFGYMVGSERFRLAMVSMGAVLQIGCLVAPRIA